MSTVALVHNFGFLAKTKDMKKRNKFFVALSAIALTLGVFVIVQSIYGNGLFSNNTFYDGSTINGVNVSGLTVDEASNIVTADLLSKRDKVSLELKYKDKVWRWTGADFEPNNEVQEIVRESFEKSREGNIFERRARIKQTRLEGKDYSIPYTYVLGGIDEKLESVASEIDNEPVDAEVKFDPKASKMFVFTGEVVGEKVELETLKAMINDAFKYSINVSCEVPVTETQPAVTVEELEANTALRSKFSTSIASSNEDRKHNVRHALDAFCGMIVAPDQEVSFNSTTGSRTAENGYKKANVILNGVYVEGTGGGVCQSSTTLYNALILSDLEILEVNPHSLPASYVPLAFDAMVSEGYSDLVFKNNTAHNLYINTYGDDKNVYVEIYGEPLEEGLEIGRKADFVGVLPHPGDRIVKDENHEYADKVTYEGEYYRLKYPREGYESKAYLQYYKNGELMGEKLIRHEIYKPQEGIIIEGTEALAEGMTLPENTVKFIPPQDVSPTNEESVDKKIEAQNPPEYNP